MKPDVDSNQAESTEVKKNPKNFKWNPEKKNPTLPFILNSEKNRWDPVPLIDKGLTQILILGKDLEYSSKTE